jgi:hypothetical protein
MKKKKKWTTKEEQKKSVCKQKEEEEEGYSTKQETPRLTSPLITASFLSPSTVVHTLSRS